MVVPGFCLPVDDEIQLCLLELRHAPAVFQLVQENREYLAQWLPWALDEPSLAKTEAFINERLRRFAEGRHILTGIWYQDQLVGLISCALNPRLRAGEIGYWLAEPFLGRGIMTRACRALVTYGFEVLGLQRIEIRVATDNTRSQAIPKRLGFRQEGVLRRTGRIGDRYIDLIVYAMLAEDWSAHARVEKDHALL